MSSDGTALRHNALVYASKDEYLARTVPFLKAGIEAGEGAGVAHTKPGLPMMRGGPRPQAARGTLLDRHAPLPPPGRTLAPHHPVHLQQPPHNPTPPPRPHR